VALGGKEISPLCARIFSKNSGVSTIVILTTGYNGNNIKSRNRIFIQAVRALIIYSQVPGLVGSPIKTIHHQCPFDQALSISCSSKIISKNIFAKSALLGHHQGTTVNIVDINQNRSDIAMTN